jgi:hypothetical protein
MRAATKPATKVPKATNHLFSIGEFVSFAIFACFVFAFVVPTAASVVDPELRIVIRTYDAPSTAGDLAPALAAARTILEDAGIAITWVSCDTVFMRRDEDPCLAPLAANELAIRFVRLAPRQTPHDLVALGDALVDTRLRTGSLATIYIERVSTLARRCGVDVRTLLGRAMAHEIGHLLLGTAAHAASGVMRAAWSPHTLRSERAEYWTFAPQEAGSMRDAVRVRNARRLAAARLGE